MTSSSRSWRPPAPATPRRYPPCSAGQRAYLLRQLHALADARGAASTTAVESLLITAAELHIRADLGVVDAAETTLTADPAVVSQQSSPGLNSPQSAAI